MERLLYEKKKTPGLIKLGSVIICLCVFVMSIVLGANLSIRGMGSDDYVKSNLDVDSLKEYVKEHYAEDMELFTEEMALYLEDEEVSQKQVEEILDKMDFTDFLDSYVQKIVNYFTKGSRKPVLRTRDVIRLIKDNEQEIGQIIGETPDREFYNLARIVIEDNIDSFNDEVSSVLRQCQEYKEPLQFLSSDAVLIGFGAAIVVLMLILIFIYGLSGCGIYRAFRSCAVPVGLAGAGMIVVRYVLVYVVKTNADLGKGELDAIEQMLAAVRNSGLLFGGLCIVCIAAAVISYLFYRKKRKAML